jgi:FkbM family methyltransferase
MLDKIKRFIYKRYNISFSKSGDDIQLMKLINNNTPGTYVDIGCWDPKKASNTYHFYVRKWRGICIDPNPELKTLYEKYRPNDTFINCGISESNSKLDFYMLNKESCTSMNSFNLDFIKKHNLENKIKEIVQISTFPLKDVLDQYLVENERLDFFDIDVEGMDLEVLKSNDWEKYRPKVIIIETDISLKKDINSEIVNYLEMQDYVLRGKSIINGDLGNLFLVNNR